MGQPEIYITVSVTLSWSFQCAAAVNLRIVYCLSGGGRVTATAAV